MLPDESSHERLLHAYAVAICNGTTFGAGMRVAPMAQPDDGLLEVITFETATRLRMALRLRTLYSGRHLRQPGVNHFRCRALTLVPQPDHETRATERGRADEAHAHGRHPLFPLDMDGDALGDAPLDVGLLPRALRLCVPQVHPGS